MVSICQGPSKDEWPATRSPCPDDPLAKQMAFRVHLGGSQFILTTMREENIVSR